VAAQSIASLLVSFIPARSYQQLYEKIGYVLEPLHVFRVEQAQRSACLRRALGDELKTLFPEHVAVIFTRRGKRSILRIDDTFMVSILFCRQEKTEVGYYWAVQPAPAERDCITLICLLNRRYERVLHYHVFPKTGNWKHRSIYLNSPLLRETVRLERLSDFYVTVKRLWEERSTSEQGLSLPPAFEPK